MVDSKAKGDAEDDEPKIADASELFRDEPRRPAAAKQSSPAAGADEAAPDGYDMEEAPEPPPAPAAPTRPRVELEPAAAPKRGSRTRYVPPGAAGVVDPVWSRAAEWGANLTSLGVVAVVVLFLVIQTMGNPGLAFLLLIVGVAAFLVLAYPIFITLERPVRITPEQAVKDFYEALSHRMPSYKRMWLLLTSAGRSSASFTTYQGFKNYWKGRLAQLRGDRAGSLTALEFRVEDFKSEKSEDGKTAEGTFTVNVYLAVKEAPELIDTIKVETTLVRGPDNMWYLSRGTLPGVRL